MLEELHPAEQLHSALPDSLATAPSRAPPSRKQPSLQGAVGGGLDGHNGVVWGQWGCCFNFRCGNPGKTPFVGMLTMSLAGLAGDAPHAWIVPPVLSTVTTHLYNKSVYTTPSCALISESWKPLQWCVAPLKCYYYSEWYIGIKKAISLYLAHHCTSLDVPFNDAAYWPFN